jgi:hypothetical protein
MMSDSISTLHFNGVLVNEPIPKGKGMQVELINTFGIKYKELFARLFPTKAKKNWGSTNFNVWGKEVKKLKDMGIGDVMMGTGALVVYTGTVINPDTGTPLMIDGKPLMTTMVNMTVYTIQAWTARKYNNS